MVNIPLAPRIHSTRPLHYMPFKNYAKNRPDVQNGFSMRFGNAAIK